MNNEEKILSMLETLITEQQKTNKRLDSLEQSQARLESKVDNLETEVTGLKQEVRTVKEVTMRMENDHGKHLANLYDAFTVNSDKNIQLEPRVIRLEDTVEHHSLEILALKTAP